MSWSFYFCIEVSCQGDLGGITSSILAHSSLTQVFTFRKPIFFKLKKKVKKCSLYFNAVAKVFCFLLLIYKFYCHTPGKCVDYSIV